MISRSMPAEAAESPTYRVVVARDHELIRAAARLHHEALSDGGFITLFGVGFLEELYTGILELGVGFLVVALEKERLAGFILACEHSDRLMWVVARRWYHFLPRMVGPLLRRPALVRKVVQTLSYSRLQQTTARAELVVIAVQPELRSQGVGRGLLGVLADELSRRGVRAYKVTVHDVMERSNRFYRANGMELVHRFRLYDLVWNVYLKQIGPS
jgi:GNAT superfamily N-acetyltransferase